MVNSYPTTVRPAAKPAGDWRARNRAAYEQARRLRLDGVISIGAQETFDQLVKECGRRTYTEITEFELATKRQVARRTIQEHISRLKTAGLLRVEEAGNLRRKHITAFDLNDPVNDPKDDLQVENDPEVLLALARQECVAGRINRAGQIALQAVMLQAGVRLDPQVVEAPGVSFFAADLNDPKCAELTHFGSSSTFKRDLGADLINAPNPQTPETGGGRNDRRKGFFRREEPAVPETAATRILRTVGVRDSQTLRRLAGRDAGDIQSAIAALQSRSSPPRDLPGLLVHVLQSGLWQPSSGPPPGPPESASPFPPRLKFSDLVKAQEERHAADQHG